MSDKLEKFATLGIGMLAWAMAAFIIFYLVMYVTVGVHCVDK